MPAADAVIVAVAPAQIAEGLELIETVGKAFTTTLTVFEFTHPAALLPLTV